MSKVAGAIAKPMLKAQRQGTTDILGPKKPDTSGQDALRAGNDRREREQKAEMQDIKQQEARKNAASRRARNGSSGLRSLLSNGFKGFLGGQGDKLG